MNKKNENSEVFIIPTHRDCKKSVCSLIEEIKKIKCNRDKVLVVVDNSKKSIYEQNHVFLKSKTSEVNYPIYHIGLEQMDSILTQIANDIGMSSQRIKEMMLPDDIDYAKIYNMIYLLTVILGANRFHRRDSDCYYDNSYQELKYAINAEEKFLGINLNQIKNEINMVEVREYKENEKICIVGGDYLGNWNLDLEELARSSENIAKRLLEICDIPSDGIEQQMKEVYSFNIDVEEHKPVLKNTFQVVKVPECGNMAMEEIFRYLPNILGKNGMGFDYFTYFIAFLYKVPIVFHYNPILHIHDSKRYLDIDIQNYWIGILKMVDLDIIYTEIIRSGVIERLIENESGLEVLKRTVDTEFVDGLEKIINSLDTEKRIIKFNAVIDDVLIGSGIQQYIKIGEELLTKRERLLEELNLEYRNSIELIRQWKKIIGVASDMEFKQIFTV